MNNTVNKEISMSKWKTYKVEHEDLPWEMSIQLKQDEKTKSLCLEVLSFFSGGEGHIRRADGDIFKAYVMFVAPTILFKSADHTLEGVVRQFDDLEGFYPWTEENGIRLTQVDELLIDSDQFEIVSEVENDER
jgi:hypothetical protein